MIHSLEHLLWSTLCPHLALNATECKWELKYPVPCPRANPVKQYTWISVILLLVLWQWHTSVTPITALQGFRLVPGSITQGTFPGTYLLQAWAAFFPLNPSPSYVFAAVSASVSHSFSSSSHNSGFGRTCSVLKWSHWVEVNGSFRWLIVVNHIKTEEKTCWDLRLLELVSKVDFSPCSITRSPSVCGRVVFLCALCKMGILLCEDVVQIH